MTGVFTINYPATMAVIDRMTKLVEKLTRINERYESEISTLSRCRGTTKNPHNHDSQIAAYRKIISNNSKDIVDLGLLISQIFSLMTNTKMTDFYLTQLIKNMMSGDSNVPNPETSVIGESLSEQAAKKAGVRVDSRGVPIINNGVDAQAYMDALNNLTKIYNLVNVDSRTFWCQTGGWFNDSNGSAECGRTSIATMASINSKGIVKPNDVSKLALNITVSGNNYERKTVYNYSDKDGAQKGLTNYDLSSEDDLLKAVNNEIATGRAVTIHTTFTKSTGIQSEHWVTVTGTATGYAATSFNDLVGIDPWFNGENNYLGKSGSGSGANDGTRSGIVPLNSTLKNQALNIDYRMYTFRVD